MVNLVPVFNPIGVGGPGGAIIALHIFLINILARFGFHGPCLCAHLTFGANEVNAHCAHTLCV